MHFPFACKSQKSVALWGSELYQPQLTDLGSIPGESPCRCRSWFSWALEERRCCRGRSALCSPGLAELGIPRSLRASWALQMESACCLFNAQLSWSHTFVLQCPTRGGRAHSCLVHDFPGRGFITEHYQVFVSFQNCLLWSCLFSKWSVNSSFAQRTL